VPVWNCVEEWIALWLAQSQRNLRRKDGLRFP
jgi:hypothetical protein